MDMRQDLSRGGVSTDGEQLDIAIEGSWRKNVLASPDPGAKYDGRLDETRGAPNDQSIDVKPRTYICRLLPTTPAGSVSTSTSTSTSTSSATAVTFCMVFLSNFVVRTLGPLVHVPAAIISSLSASTSDHIPVSRTRRRRRPPAGIDEVTVRTSAGWKTGAEAEA
jgi:hypothetical protein